MSGSRDLAALLGDGRPTRAQKTQAKMFEATMELMREKDFGKISVTAINETAGTSRSTFYTYFLDAIDVIQRVEDLLLENSPAYNHEVRKDMRMPGVSPSLAQCQTPTWIVAWYEFVETFHDEFFALLGPHGDPSFWHRLRSRLASSYDVMMNEDGVNNDRLREAHVLACSKLQIQLLQDWLFSPSNRSLRPNEIADILNLIRIGGLYVNSLEKCQEEAPANLMGGSSSHDSCVESSTETEHGWN